MLLNVSNTTLWTFLAISIGVALIFVRLLIAPLISQGRSKTALVVSALSIGWLVIQSVLAFRGFYAEQFDLPPRFLLVIAPPLLAIALTLILLWKKEYLKALSLKTMTYLHVFRLPLELVVFTGLLSASAIPDVMTFHGRNFDILVGITAPIVGYFYFSKKIFSHRILLAWNIASLILLINISFLAIFSLPYPFQKFGIDQPNIAVLNFPFVLLPALLVAVAYFCHFVSIHKLLVYRE